eukprot:6189534-Pleurochrysis_carterae.AAC.2
MQSQAPCTASKRIHSLSLPAVERLNPANLLVNLSVHRQKSYTQVENGSLPTRSKCTHKKTPASMHERRTTRARRSKDEEERRESAEQEKTKMQPRRSAGIQANTHKKDRVRRLLSNRVC